MTSLRPFHPCDLFIFNTVNLDSLTETYDPSFYLSYLARWPHLQMTVVDGSHAALSSKSDAAAPSESQPAASASRLASAAEPTRQIGRPVAYLLGKTESSPSYVPKDSPHRLPHHAHVTAVTVAPAYRRLGLAKSLCEGLEQSGEADRCFFVDLFVRKENDTAVKMYRGWGYRVYRRVKEYYSDGGLNGRGEDAFDMRKPLKRDKKLKFWRETGGEDVIVQPEDVW